MTKHKPYAIQPDEEDLKNIIGAKAKSSIMKVGLKKFNEVAVEKQKHSHWIKFEQFNYPIPDSNDLFM